MPLDSLSYTAPARLRALLCPLGRIKRHRFSSFTQRLHANYVVRLGDVTPDPQRTLFSPSGFPDGQIVFDLVTSMDREHESLESFEHHRRTWAVIAIADYTEKNDETTLQKQYEELRFLYPNALYYVCLMFDAPADGIPDYKSAHSQHPCFIAVPPEKDAKVTSIRTVVCDIASRVFSEMHTYGKAIQAMPTLESPGSSESRPGSSKEHRLSVPTTGGGLAPPDSSIARKRTTMTGFGSSGVTERTKNKGKGRVQIAIAQLHLLSGRVPTALKEFVEGAEVCKASNDHLWHGKALEGIGVCLVVLAHLKQHFQIPHIPFPSLDLTKGSSPKSSKPGTPQPSGPDATPKTVLELLPELHEAITNLYNRSANFPGEACPKICFSETILRHCKALAALHLSNSNAEAVIEHIVIGTPLPALSGPVMNDPSRFDIALILMRAYPEPLQTFTVLEATRILSAIASILGAIGLQRKKAFVARELLKILIPGLIQARVVGAAEVGVHPAAGLSLISGGGSALDLAEGDVEHGILDLLDNVCRSYGILPPFTFEEDEDNKKRFSTGSAMLKTAAVTKAVIAEQEIRSFGWPALKINVLRNCTALCEALPDFAGVLKFTRELLRLADTELSREEQLRLSTTIARTVGAAAKLGLNEVQAEYWDQFLLRDVELVENPLWKSPVPHSRAELDEADSDSGRRPSAPIVAKTPFIYNPKNKAAKEQAEKLLVRGETAEFRVTLQNPYAFEVEVESVTLDATGVDIEQRNGRTSIPPNNITTASVLVTPKETGDVLIAGCKIKVYGCRERSFPIFTEGLDPREREPKKKRYGLKAVQPEVDRPVSTVSNRSGRLPPVLHPIPKSLLVKVVDQQPLLVVKHTSLSQGAIMLLEGERKVFDITFQNLTPVDVDLLVFSFTDSTTAQIQQALHGKQGSAMEMYDLEMMLENRPAFLWHRPDKPSKPTRGRIMSSAAESRASVVASPPKRTVYVPANGTATFQISVLGKPGLTQGSVIADYSHLSLPRAQLPDRFYTRQTIFPVTVTVNASIDVARLDVLPFTPDLSAHPVTSATYPPISHILSTPDPENHTLLLIDLRNTWVHPLHVSLTVNNTTPPYTTSATIHASHTERLVLPLRRLWVENPSLPIPILGATRNRQFIVSAHKISLEAERQAREAFWYREALLATLSCTWTDPATAAAGDVSLRSILLSPRIVDTLRVPELDIVHTIDGPGVRQVARGANAYIVPTEEFVTVTTTVTNRTRRTLQPLLRMLPALRGAATAEAALDMSRRVVFNGVLQRTLGVLGEGETRVVRQGVVVLVRGEYEITASVEEVGGGGEGEVWGGLDEEGRPVDVLGGRGRGWWAGRGVRIIARDGPVEESGEDAGVGEGGEGAGVEEAAEEKVEEAAEEKPEETAEEQPEEKPQEDPAPAAAEDNPDTAKDTE